MVAGKEEEFDSVLDYLKRSKASFGIPNSSDAIRIFPVTNMQADLTPEGMSPSKSGPVKLFDGFQMLTTVGRNKIAGGNATSSKSVISGLGKFWSRTLNKGNQIYVNSKTVEGLDPALVDLWKAMEDHNEEHPDNQCDLISVMANQKVMPDNQPGAKNGFPALTYDAKGLHFHANVVADLSNKLQEVPGDYSQVMSHLSESTEPGELTVPVLMLSSNPVQGAKLAWDILRQATMDNWDGLPSWKGSLKDLQENLPEYLREDNENDRRILAALKLGVDVRDFPGKYGEPSLMIVARMRNRLAGLNGVRSQHTPNLLTPVTLPKGLIKDVLDTRAYMWRAKDGKIQQSTQMKDIPANVRVYGNPAGLAANIKGVPVTERKTLYSTNPNGKEVAIAAVWNMNRPDVFESELDETPGSESVQLKKEFLPDIEEALDIKSRKKGNTWEHSFTLRGALVAGDNSPNTGPESTVLFRLERQVGAGEKSNFQMMNNRLVVLAGRDFDGDAQANAVVKRGKDGKLTGPRGDFVDASGKIPLTLEAGATWSPDATVTAAQFVFSRGMIYLSDSPEYFNPGRGLDPYNRRIHNEEVFKPIALKQQEKLLKKLGKWNSLESVFFMLRMPGDLAKALSVVARHRQVWLQIFRNKLALRTPVGFNIKGIDVPPDEGHTHTFELGKDEVMGDLRADAITDFSGDVFGLTADQLKDFFAPSLHINANTLKYIYSILMSNYRLIRVPKLKKNESPAEMLKSVMGTIELLQGTLLTDEGVKLPAVSKGFASLSQMAESFRLLDLFDRYRDLGTKERVAQIREAKLPANQADNVFDIPDALRRVPEWQLTLAGVDKLDSLLPDETKLMSVADLISGQSEDFQKNRETYLLEVWNHLSDNLFARSLRAVLDTQKNKYPAINRPAMSTLEQDAVSASFLKLPSRTQLALIIFAYEKWGMSKYDPESYVSILPDEAMLRLQGMLGKSVKALGGQEAAALAPGRTGQPVPAATKAPSAPVSETQSFLKANQKHIASDEQKFSDTIKASLVTSRVIPEAMNLPGLNVRQKLQENMRTRVTFVDRLVRMVGLATFVMRRNSGRELPEAVQARSAIPYYLDSGMDLKAKLRTKDNVGMDLTVELVDGVPKLTKTPVDLDDMTVGDAFKAYEKLRARSPERLVPWQELLPEGIKVTKDVLDAVNKHAAEAGIPEMVDDITKRLRAVTGKEGTVYVHHGTMFPLTDMGERIQETMLKFFTAPAEEREFGVTIRVTPQDVTTTRTKTTPLTAAMKYLNELSAEKREAEVARLVESVPETLREYSILQETTGITQLRKIATLDEKFKKYGVILRNPDYADLLDQYVAEIANYAADRRMLTLFFNATDYAGIPAAMISQRTPANEPGKRPPKEQTLLSRDALFTMFVNWRRRLQMDGIAVEPFDPAKTHWENLDRLESLATKGWFTDNGYEYTELKNVEGFSHAWVQKGAPIQLLKHITSRGIGDWPDEGPIGVVKKMLQGLLWFNQVTKQTALSFSLFHSGSLLESHGAAYGLTLKNPFLNPWQLVKDLWAMRTMAKQTLTDPKMRGLMSLWMEANLEFRFSDRDPLEAEKRGEGGALDEGMTAIIDRSNKVAMLRPVGKSMHAVRSIKRKMDRLLWEVQQPASKLMLAERIFSEALSNPDYAEIADSPGGEMKIRKEIARLVNQQFGGLDWREMLWATPTARDFLRLAFFAPDWTFANLQVAMVPDFLQRITGVRMPFGPVSTTDIRSKELLNKYWPAYITLVFGWLPMVWQFAIYGAFGDPDKGDKPLIFMNEEGRDNAIDVTPFMRRLGKRFGITEKRRVYLQWGKQAREILNWFQDPLKTGLGKTSMSAKAAYEQITGRNTAGWNLPWTRDDDTSFLASWFVVDGKMSDSRLSYVFQKFVPMTIQSWVDSNRPPTIFAPMKLGMSSFTAERVIADVLQAYGDEGFRMWLSGRPERVKRLETLVIGTLDAAWLNGYPVKTIMSRAKGMAHRAQTKRFFDVLEANPKNPDVAKLEIAARALLRTGDTAKKLYNRIEYKYTQRGRVMTDAQREALFEAERNAQEKLGE
ncbi:hypothetical protein KJ680_14305 [bacterium]|nr:hypothetical protein [bacterium]